VLSPGSHRVAALERVQLTARQSEQTGAAISAGAHDRRLGCHGPRKSSRLRDFEQLCDSVRGGARVMSCRLRLTMISWIFVALYASLSVQFSFRPEAVAGEGAR